MPPETPAASPTDEELARRAQQGCSASFEELVRRFQVPLLHFLRYRFGAAEAEDLVQDTFVRAYENLHRYRGSWRFATWLFTIGRRLSINSARRRRPAANGEALDSIRSAVPPPEQVVVEEEGRRLLWELAAEILTEKQHTVVWLYYVEDMPIKQIAKVVRRSATSVKTMLFRARKKLMKEIEGPEPGETSAGRGKRLQASSH